jgi:hypothetical protein
MPHYRQPKRPNSNLLAVIISIALYASPSSLIQIDTGGGSICFAYCGIDIEAPHSPADTPTPLESHQRAT